MSYKQFFETVDGYVFCMYFRTQTKYFSMEDMYQAFEERMYEERIKPLEDKIAALKAEIDNININ